MAISNKKQTFPADVKMIWDIVTDNQNYSWRSDLERIEILGEGSEFIEHTKDGFATRFTITKKEPYTRYEFKMENDFISGVWVGLFSEVDGKTELDFTEDVKAQGMIRKIMLPFYLKHQQKKYLKDLEKALNK